MPLILILENKIICKSVKERNVNIQNSLYLLILKNISLSFTQNLQQFF